MPQLSQTGEKRLLGCEVHQPASQGLEGQADPGIDVFMSQLGPVKHPVNVSRQDGQVISKAIRLDPPQFSYLSYCSSQAVAKLWAADGSHR